MNDAHIKSWERLVEGTISQARKLVEGFALTPIDGPPSEIPLSKFAFELVRDPAVVDREVRANRNSESVRLLALNLLARVLLNHLSACYQLLRVPLQQESGILLRSMLEVVDLMEFIRSDRCTDDDLVAWWKGEIIEHGRTRKGATTMVTHGTLREQLDEALIKIVGSEPVLVEAVRKAQYRTWSRPVHHASRAVAEATLPEFTNNEHRLTGHFSEFHSYLVWTLRAVPFYFGSLLSENSRQLLARLGDDLAHVIFDDGLDDWCRDLSEYYGQRAL